MPLTGAFRAAFLPQNRAFFVLAALPVRISGCEFPHSDETERRSFTFSTEIRKGINGCFRTGETSNPQNYLTPFFIVLFISFQSGSLSSATLWIINNAFACSVLTAARSEKIKASSRRTRRAPQSYNLSSSSTPPLQNRRRPGPKGRNSIALRGML